MLLDDVDGSPLLSQTYIKLNNFSGSSDATATGSLVQTSCPPGMEILDKAHSNMVSEYMGLLI
jgi:hypothetical protein